MDIYSRDARLRGAGGRQMNLKYKGFTVFIPDAGTITVSESAPNDVQKVIEQLNRTSLFDNVVLRGIIVDELRNRGYEALA